MADHDWSKEAIFDAPLVQRELEQRIKMQRPAGVDARIVSPPVQQDLRVILDNPQLAAELWNQVQEPDAAPPAEKPPTEAETAVQMALALSLLHALHTQDIPGREHLAEPNRAKPRRNEDDLGVDEL